MQKSARLRVLTGVLVLLLSGWGLFHRSLNRRLSSAFFLTVQRPNEDTFQELASQPDPAGFLRRCWDTGKVAHRELVASFLKDIAHANPPWFSSVRDLVLAGTRDADMSVREVALATLELRSDPALLDCAEVQLGDADPLVRLLGVEALRKADPRRAIPLLAAVLDESNLLVLARTESILMRLTGEDFGVRVRQAVADHNAGGIVTEENAAQIREGIARRRAWWRLHQGEYPASPGLKAEQGLVTPSLADFELGDLNGKRVRLDEFRGRPVLVNFWATWCPACLEEIPALAALERKGVAIVGIALDGVPDDHGHHPGAEGLGSASIRDQVRRTVATRGIHYTVLLDPGNTVGARFNGGELPTSLIIDADGRLRRRFVGRRSLDVLESFVAEAARPWPGEGK